MEPTFGRRSLNPLSLLSYQAAWQSNTVSDSWEFFVPFLLSLVLWLSDRLPSKSTDWMIPCLASVVVVVAGLSLFIDKSIADNDLTFVFLFLIIINLKNIYDCLWLGPASPPSWDISFSLVLISLKIREDYHRSRYLFLFSSDQPNL